MKENIKISICLLLPAIVVLLPLNSFGIEGLTIVEQRTIAIFLLAALLWVLEPIPIYATSILIIVLELLTISTSSIVWLRSASSDFGTLLPYKDIMSTFASPIILLFLGGFFLALAASKYRLDLNLARVLLKPFGNKSSNLLLGIMAITAFFSMFMSNTATTAMMLSIIIPVLNYFDPKDPGKIAFTLSIPLAANIGGIGTPIGTPPNAIALKYLVGENAISFSEWMLFGVPYVLILVLIGWVLLRQFFPSEKTEVALDIKGKFMKSKKAFIVYITFGFTVLLWLTDFVHGMNSYVVALIPVAVFLITGVVNKEDIKKLSWDVLWLVSGGIALGLAIDKTGLATNLVNSIPFDSFAPFVIIGISALLAAVMANFMSNTATANLLLPIMAALGVSAAGLEALGGVKTLVLGVALAASMGMALPISTPPNALAHASGAFETKHMAKVGIVTGIIGLVLIFLFLYLLRLVNFL
ncbi:MAG: SLC13 family permease [Bacteroidota bacterium]